MNTYTIPPCEMMQHRATARARANTCLNSTQICTLLQIANHMQRFHEIPVFQEPNPKQNFLRTCIFKLLIWKAYVDCRYRQRAFPTNSNLKISVNARPIQLLILKPLTVQTIQKHRSRIRPVYSSLYNL